MSLLSVCMTLFGAYGLASLVHPCLVGPATFKLVFIELAELLGTSAPVASPAAQLVVTAVPFLVAQQLAVLMATAVGRACLVELLAGALEDYLHAAILLGASVILLGVGGVQRDKVLETPVRWGVGL